MTQKTSPKRTDALRNRERVLQAAREAFAEGGAAVSMAEIIRRSGIGSATVYRNFPSRRDLLEAVYVEEVNEVLAAASTITGETAQARLMAWLRRFSQYVICKRPVAIELLDHVDRTDAVFETSRDAIAKIPCDPDYREPILELALAGLRRSAPGRTADINGS
jgi:AcrR family transcriptional regulator